MKITIVGGGNIATQFMVHCAEKGHEVTVYTSNPNIFKKHLNIVDENNTTTHEGDIKIATNDPHEAFFNADLILVTVPANVMYEFANTIYENTKSSCIIGVVPGNGGSECCFKKCIERGNIFFSIERVPAVARLVKKGQTVKSTGYREELHVSSLPISYVKECCEIVSSIFDIPCKPIPNILNLTLTPSNPILHTSRLKTLFHDYLPGVVYSDIPLFYEEWNDETSELLFKMDDEVQKICKALPEYKLQYVKSLKDHYESTTISAMTKKISSISAFKGLTTPTIRTDDGFIPDLHSRYFTADFNYGLTIIQQVARLAGVKTSNIDKTMDWYRSIALEKKEFRYKDFGINTREEFENLYLR